MLGLRSRQNEQRAQATTWGDWAGDVTPSWSGTPVDTRSSLQLLTVYGCNRFIGDGIATLPIDVFSGKPDGTRVNVKPPRWLDQPTADLDRVAWLTQLLTSLLLDGNAYCWKEYGETGLESLRPLDPAQVQVRREAGKKVFYVAGGRYDWGRVLHIPGLMFPGSDVGMSPVEYAKQSIGVGLSAQEYGARYFGQDATPAGVIEVPTEMDPEKTKEMARFWNRRHSGKNKSHLPGVLVGGAKWKTTGVTNEQAQFLETRRFTAAEIAGQMFLVDPADLGIVQAGTSLTYANLEQRSTRRVQVTYLPWLVRLEAAISALLAAPRFMKFNVNGLLRGDTKTRYEAHSIGITSGFLLRSEARELEDLKVIGGLDDEPMPATAPVVGSLT